MKIPSIAILASIVLLFPLAACGGRAPSVPDGGCDFPSAPLTTVTTDGGLEVAVRSCPNQPPTRGLDELQYTVTTPSGAPEDGLTMTVVPWMPDMGHGGSVTPVVTPEGHGVYLVTDVYFYMPGPWQLRTTFQGPVTDSVTPVVQIQ